MKKRIVLFLFLINFSLNAQTVETVLSKLNTEYSSAKALQFETKYNLYKNKTAKQVYESYSGVFKKNERNEMYQKIDKTEFISSKKLSLNIIHPDELIIVSNSEPMNNSAFELKKLLEFCKIKSFADKKNYWELTLESKPFSGLEYSEVVIQINKNYFIQKQLFYYNTAINFSSDFSKQDIDLPVLEIIYTNFNRNKIEDSYFDVSKYIMESNKTIKPSKKYPRYTVEDQREITIK
ncbi:hypothetical protein [Flavobacterium sp.]|jgi:hypothetical protein|uniref:hypothetical protein n=1 Tax=Flavobacterium sp. TaxID=239 RepID=UPI00404734A7